MNMPLVLLNRRRRGFTAFSPSTLFSTTAIGVWLDPSDVANLAWRRNLLTYSEQFDNAAWAKNAASISANTLVAPDGTTTADKVVENTATTAPHRVQQTFAIVGTSIAASCYIKAAERTFAYIRIDDASSTKFAWFNLSSGIVGTVNSGLTASIQSVGNDWYRCTAIYAAPAATNSGSFVIGASVTDGVQAYTGDGTSGILIWGAQLELGSVATDYQRISDVTTEVIERFPSATLYQDPAGTTPVTTPGQTVGLMLDKSRGLVLGAELVVNGTFDTNTNDWAAINGVISVVDQTLKASETGTFVRAVQGIATSIGKTYVLRGDIRLTNGISAILRATNDSAGGVTGLVANSATVTSATFQSVRLVFTATATTTYVAFFVNTTTDAEGFADNISVRELPGNHATQSTPTARPIYGIEPVGGRRNLLTYSEQFDNAAWVKSLATITADSSVAPDGTTTADAMVATAAAGNVREPTVDGRAATFTVSAYAKAGTVDRVRVIAVESVGFGKFAECDFNLTTQAQVTAQTGGWTVVSTEMIPVGNGWFRCVLVFTKDSSANILTYIAHTSAAVSGSSVLIWGAQLELGSTASAYQRTTTQYDVTEAGVASTSYLAFDGVDDGMVTGTITPGVDKAQVFAGVRKLSDAANIIVELSSSTGTNPGSFIFNTGTSTGAGPNYAAASRGSATFLANQYAVSAASFTAPITNTVTSQHDISGDLSAMRVNGAASGTNGTGDQGTGNYLAYPLYLGRRGGTTLPFKGNVYSLITRFGANLDAGVITNTETWVAGKTGISL